MRKKIIKEMNELIKNFAEERAKEIEQVLAYVLKEQTEVKDNKLVWTAKIETHIQSIKENIKNIESEVLSKFKKFEENNAIDTSLNPVLQINSEEWDSLVNDIRTIFERRL